MARLPAGKAGMEFEYSAFGNRGLLARGVSLILLKKSLKSSTRRSILSFNFGIFLKLSEEYNGYE